MLFIPITIAGALFQVGRNALQRGLVPLAGPWGATLVRFLFGLPFTVAILAAAYALSPGADPHFGARFWIAATIGAVAQVSATAALLVAMRRSGFAMGAAFQQSSLPIGALIGILFHDQLSARALGGIALATVGLLALSWPRSAAERSNWTGAVFGLVSGACYGVALNAFRQAAVAVDPGHPVFSGIAALTVVQAMQSVGLGGLLALFDPRSLGAALRSWRASLGAGVCGSAASAMWFIALALAPAGAVRAVGVAEMPLAALVGRRLFRERLSLWQIVAGLVTAVGVVLAALR